MPKYQKYVNALFIAAAFVVWLIVQHYLGVAVGYFQLGRTLGPAVEWIQIALPLLAGAATFLALRQNQVVLNFTTDSIAELTKVSWPGTREVRFGTIIVIITVILAAVFLGILDVGITAVVKALIGVK